MEVKKETIGILASFLLALPLLGGGYWVINSLMNQPAKTITDQTSPQSIEEPESNVDSTHIFVKDEISITDLDDSYRYNSEEETEAMVLDDIEEDTEDTEDNSMEEEANMSDSIQEVNVGNENPNSSVVNSTERTNARQENQPVQEKKNSKPEAKQPEKKEQKNKKEQEKPAESKDKKGDQEKPQPKKEEKGPQEENKKPTKPKENQPPSQPKENVEKPTEPSDNNDKENTGSSNPPSTDKDNPKDEPGDGDSKELPEALG